MNQTVPTTPKGYHSVTPYLIVKNAKKAIEFYQQAFGATLLMKFDGPEGKVNHSELKIGDSIIMLADEVKDAKAPQEFGMSPVGFLLYVENVDDLAERVIAAGGKLTRPLENMFYGDRVGSIEDPFGHRWHIATHIEDVSPEEIEHRLAQMKK